MIVRFFLACIVSVLAMHAPVYAATTEHPLVIVRSQDDRAATAEGIWRAEGGGWRRLHPFFFNSTVGGLGAALGTIEDRVVFQGPAYLEFDVPSGRLLRRYSSLPAGAFGWAFHGALVDEADAQQLGIPSGTYGFPVCAQNGGGAGGCALHQFPGYARATQNDTDYRFLYRRSLDPSDATLTLVRTFDDTDFVIQHRDISLDATRHRFLLFSEGYQRSNSEIKIERLSGFTVTDPREFSITEARADITRDPWDRFRSSLFLAVAGDALYQTFRYYLASSNDFQFVRRSIDGSAETVLEQGQSTQPTSLPIAAASLRDAQPTARIQLIPVIGDTAGANGHWWRSDVWMFNASNQEATVTLERLSTGRRVLIVLHPYETRIIRRALHDLGGGPQSEGGDGVGLDALKVAAPPHVAVTSRTYTEDATGEYSQVVPPVPDPTGYSTHLNNFGSDLLDESTQSTFVLDKRTPDAYRHNLGIVNTTDREVEVKLRYGTLSSREVNPDLERTIMVEPRVTRLVTIEQLFPDDVVRTRPPRLAVAADAAIPIWLSMVDNVTGDATFLAHELYSFRPDGSRLAAPGLTFGDDWDADLIGQFPAVPAAQTIEPAVSYFPVGCPALTTTLRGVVGNASSADDPWWHSIFPSLATQLTACATGTMEVDAATWMAGFVRMNTPRNGGTLTDAIPLFPLGGWERQDFPLDLTAGASVALHLYNGTETQSAYEIEVFSGFGTAAGAQTVTIDAHETRTLDLRQTFGLTDGEYGISTRAIAAEAGVWATLTVEDTSGDRSTW